MARFPLAALCFCLALMVAQATPADDRHMVEAGLEADDVCTTGATAGECSLELRQLRLEAKRQAMEVQQEREGQAGEYMEDDAEDVEEKEGDAPLVVESWKFGLDAEGENMWAVPTWGDTVAMLQSNVSTEEASRCDFDTGGTCSLLSCASSRGATMCSKGRCLCQEGFCSKAGLCYPSSPAMCISDTGGTCAVGSCSSSRGNTKCKSRKCLCKTGGCAWKGSCLPITDTGGSCSVLSCSSSRGPTTCHRGRCLCQNGFVSVKGRCERY